MKPVLQSIQKWTGTQQQKKRKLQASLLNELVMGISNRDRGHQGFSGSNIY
jgi:hypothetical protein